TNFIVSPCAVLQCFTMTPRLANAISSEPAKAPGGGGGGAHGNILTPLLKALSENERWPHLTPRARPDSRFVRYMKRLYKASAKAERGREAKHLYNTVRLIAPRDGCLQQGRPELFVQDLSYSLDQVRSQEELLKSVLLYPFDPDQTTSLTPVCFLDVKEHESSGQQLPSTAHYSVTFSLHPEKRRRHRWVEVDVTRFLHPLIKTHRKDLHLLINLTCVEGGELRVGHRGVTLSSPSLLLFLNDTSDLAHQRGSTSSFSRNLFGAEKAFEDQEEFSPDRRLSRGKRNPSSSKTPKPTPSSSPLDLMLKSGIPTDDCELYDFRVSFSQLKLDHWIIAPHKYNARYCKGTCPRVMGYIYGSPVHTMVQNIIYEKLDSSVPRPSCVPSEYNPLSVLTIENDGSIAYKEYEEMIATKCTCR
uniref:Growth/differentiation factor 9 n=1 Tax=Denticeps clupeoides TaxID=299321 RepID=A0AAY4ALP7_9TELE